MAVPAYHLGVGAGEDSARAVAAAQALGEGVSFLQIPQPLPFRRFPFCFWLLGGLRLPGLGDPGEVTRRGTPKTHRP